MLVIWTLPALNYLDDIQDHIAKESPKAAHRFVNSLIDRTEQMLSTNPKIGRTGRVAGTRELVVARTSYIVVYRILDHVEILAVVHAAREWPEKFD
jgi:toxin ParE1/3/4